MDLVREDYGGEPYEYYPLGQHVVAAPGICGGRPTFKYTRIDVSFILDRIAHGESIEELVEDYANPNLTVAAVEEAISLAAEALTRSVQTLQPAV